MTSLVVTHRAAARAMIEKATGRRVEAGGWLSSPTTGGGDGVLRGEFFGAVLGRNFVAFDVREESHVSRLGKWSLDDIDAKAIDEMSIEISLPWPSGRVRLTAVDEPGAALLKEMVRRTGPPSSIVLAIATPVIGLVVGALYLYRAVVIEGDTPRHELPWAALITALTAVLLAVGFGTRARRRRRFRQD